MNKLTGKKVTNISPFKTINAVGQNFFAAQQPVGEFWNVEDKTAKQEKLSVTESIQRQIHDIEAQTEEYNEILANPFGRNLNVVG